MTCKGTDRAPLDPAGSKTNFSKLEWGFKKRIEEMVVGRRVMRQVEGLKARVMSCQVLELERWFTFVCGEGEMQGG